MNVDQAHLNTEIWDGAVDSKKKKKHKLVSEQVATATVFLGAHASSLHWRGDAED